MLMERGGDLDFLAADLRAGESHHALMIESGLHQAALALKHRPGGKIPRWRGRGDRDDAASLLGAVDARLVRRVGHLRLGRRDDHAADARRVDAGRRNGARYGRIDVESCFRLMDRAGPGSGQERVPARLLRVLADQQAGDILQGDGGRIGDEKGGRKNSRSRHPRHKMTNCPGLRSTHCNTP